MATKAPKQDLRNGMWERRPGTAADQDNDRKTIENVDNRDPKLAKPGFRPQAEGQTTHQ